MNENGKNNGENQLINGSSALNSDRKKRGISLDVLICGSVFIALFAVVSNIPFLSSFQPMPGVPFSLQPLLIMTMCFLLGLRGSFVSYVAILLLTLAGIPMMSGGRGGLSVLAGPTAGYIYGWVFLVLLCGIYKSFFAPWLKASKNIKTKGFFSVIKNKNGTDLNLKAYLLFSLPFILVSLILMYVTGAAFYVFTSTGSGNVSSFGQFFSVFKTLFLSNLVLFFPLDIIKGVLAVILAYIINQHPLMKRISKKVEKNY